MYDLEEKNFDREMNRSINIFRGLMIIIFGIALLLYVLFINENSIPLIYINLASLGMIFFGIGAVVILFCEIKERKAKEN